MDIIIVIVIFIIGILIGMWIVASPVKSRKVLVYENGRFGYK